MDPDNQWTDITQDVLTMAKQLKFLQCAFTDTYNLQLSMQAHEIGDPKIDPKFDLTPQCTIQHHLNNKLIKLPQDLSINQIKSIYRIMLKYETQVLSGLPLGQTIYTFTYLFDKSICQKNNKISILVQSINCLGSYIFEIIKEASTIKEDDTGTSTFAYNKNHLSNDEIMEEMIKVQKQLETQLKKSKIEQEQRTLNQLLCYLRLRRSIHSLTKAMGRRYQSKAEKKINTQISAVRKKIIALQQAINANYNQQKLAQEITQTVDGVFSNKMYKTLRTHFGPREIKPIGIQDSIKILNQTLDQFELFIPTPLKWSDWKNRVESMQNKKLNLWSKSYIKANMFAKQDYLMNTVKTEDALVTDINDWVPLSQNIKNDDKFKQLIKTAGPVLNETLYRLLGNQSRWWWQCSRVYQDYNYIIYLANDFDNTCHEKKGLMVCSWFYYYGLDLMIKQLLVAFKTDIYEPWQWPYTFCYLRNLLEVYEKNAQFFIKKMDKTYMSSFQQGTLIHKKKKKVDQNIRKMFTNINFKKGLWFYFRALHNIVVVIQSRGQLLDPFQKQLKIRINNRFRIFKSIAFLKKLDYNEYIKIVTYVKENQKECLQQSFELLKQAKNIFQRISQLQDTDCFEKQREDAAHLMKMCVQSSLATMALRMNQKKTFKLEKKHQVYPEITIS